MSRLLSELNSDDTKKAFWINIYNAYLQWVKKEGFVKKADTYKAKRLVVAGLPMSLDMIEHGILRRFRYKYSLGYLPNPLVAPMIKKLAVDKIDGRIHFALNCGAKSCPLIAFYTVASINHQLAIATLSFLESETTVFHDKQEVHISRLFKWYLADFGGKKGIKNLIKENLDLSVEGYQWKYKTYSWEEQLANYDEGSFLG